MIYKGKDNGRGATGNYNSAWTQELHTKKEGDWVEKAVRSLTMCTVLVVYCPCCLLTSIKPLKREAIHETGLSGYVVASFFPLIIFIIYIYIYIYGRWA